MNQIESIVRRLGPELDAMNGIIASSMHTDNDMMDSIVSRYLQTKGKQLRPLMVILSAKLFGGVTDDVLHAAAALEMLHNASLIHDDVVDETPMRRGEPTINNMWGNRIAVLVGDFFVSNALAAGIRTGNINIISALSALGSELSLGEIDQICNVRDRKLDEESYFNMIRQKTASLFRNCVKVGSEAVGADESQYAPLVQYAELLGLCFQIKDDIFDYFDQGSIGKPTGNDLREGKVTLPLLHAFAVADVEEAAAMRGLLTDMCSDSDIATLIAFAKDKGGIDYAYSRMRELQSEADGLIQHLPDSEWKEAFRDIFDFIISRDY